MEWRTQSQDGQYPESFRRFCDQLKHIEKERIEPNKVPGKCYRCWKRSGTHLCLQCKYTLECVEKEPIGTSLWSLVEMEWNHYLFGNIRYQKQCALTRTECKNCWFKPLSAEHRGFRDFCIKCMESYYEEDGKMFVIQKQLPARSKSARKF